MRGIEAAAAYVPRLRVEAESVREMWGQFNGKGIETKAVPAADEDVVTMAVEAAERALERTNSSREECRFLGVATTTPPLEEELFEARIGTILGLPKDATVRSSTRSTIGGADVIQDAIQSSGLALAIAADHPEGNPSGSDHPLGAGAAAFVISDEATVSITQSTSYFNDYPGLRHRERGSREVTDLGITTYERTAMADCVDAAVQQLDVDIDEVDSIVLHQPDGGVPFRLARSISADRTTVSCGLVADRIGDAGAATVPIGLLRALESAEDGAKTLTVFFGSGAGAVALLLDGRIDGSVEAQLDGGESIPYARYIRERGYVGNDSPSGGGAHVSVPAWRRSLEQRYRLLAGRCSNCGRHAFPPRGACPHCNSRDGYDDVELPKEGRVVASTTIGLGGAPPEFVEQQRRSGPYGVVIVAIDIGDDAVMLPAQLTGSDAESVEIGERVRGVVRRIYEEEGVIRYGLKFVVAE